MLLLGVVVLEINYINNLCERRLLLCYMSKKNSTHLTMNGTLLLTFKILCI